jgi:hypothetical protein
MTTGSDNLAFGAFAGEGLISGSSNFFVGTGAGSGVENGSNNFFLGNAAGNQFRSGSGNIIIGPAVGTQFVSGSGNLIIGQYGSKVVDNVNRQFSLTYGEPNGGRTNLFYKSGSESANLYLYGGLEIQNELRLSSGSNKQTDIITSTTDAMTVSNSLVTANSIILLTPQGTGNVNTGANLSVTGNIIGGNLLTGGLISATGNITGGNIIGTIIASSFSTAGNITGGNLLTGGLISATSTITSAANITGGNLLTAGILTATGNVISVANIIGGNITTAGLVTATGNITGGNLLTVGQISATGNITGNYYIGNGAFLTGLNAGATSSLANGATSINIPVSSGNIAMSVAGQSNTVVINLGSLTMYGTFAGPKTLNANVAVADAVNALLLGPVTLGNGYNISVPDSSTLYVFAP